MSNGENNISSFLYLIDNTDTLLCTRCERLLTEDMIPQRRTRQDNGSMQTVVDCNDDGVSQPPSLLDKVFPVCKYMPRW